MSLNDYLSLSPFLILLAGGLIVLLVETFAESKAKFLSSRISLITFVLAFAAELQAPQVTNALLTPWILSDQLAHSGALLILAIAIGVNLLSVPLFKKDHDSRSEFDFLLTMAVIGTVMIASAADLLTLFLGLEVLSLSLYVLTGYMREWTVSAEASMKYFLMGAVGAAFLVYGIALLYGATGTTRLDKLMPAYQALSLGQDLSLFWGGVAFITVGLFFKAAIVPFHFWAPDVYDGASMPVTAFMSAGVKAGAFLAFARIFLIALPSFSIYWSEAVSYFALLSLIYANFVALQQNSLRRFFAYSGISHAGFMLIALVAQGPDALSALLFYLTVYALATLIAFVVLALLDQGEAGVKMEDLKGLAYRSPFLAGVLILALLTLAGLPPTAGFFAKLYLFKIALEAGYLTLVIIALLTTALAFSYYLRIAALLFTKERVPQGDAKTASKRTLACASLASLALLTVSLFPEPLLRLFQ